MDLKDYQNKASHTNLIPNKGVIAPMLGLASETGSILNVYKKFLLGGIDVEHNQEFLIQELGDLLWYVAAVATACDLDLDEIAQKNLIHTRSRVKTKEMVSQVKIPILDEKFPKHERFPRKMIFRFDEKNRNNNGIKSTLSIVSAEPYAFESGIKKDSNGKKVGFELGKQIGASLTNNSRQEDGYRYHDAIHISFMCTFGWSPTMRDLLRIKRKSDRETDENEDGARAIYAEEGLATILSRLATKRMGFKSEASVDNDIIDIALAATSGLEVELFEPWMWREAISNGFKLMDQLSENNGGFVIADLDNRKIDFKIELPD